MDNVLIVGNVRRSLLSVMITDRYPILRICQILNLAMNLIAYEEFVKRASRVVITGHRANGPTTLAANVNITHDSIRTHDVITHDASDRARADARSP